ncbi:MAG: alanyl-tRNA editing protein [Candidatus Diapherotrites archaeon]|nr:alanyl-tRNA editing protein [Candidatus Diapherotrites archaeon]
MTVKILFRDQAYLKELKAKIVKIEQNKVWLDQTIFYAFSGGQITDTGTLNGIPVVQADMDKDTEEIVYTLESAEGLKIGQEVVIQIDWEKRYKIMRLHSLAHLTDRVFEQVCGKHECVGSNIDLTKSRLDYMYPENLNTVLPKIQEQVQQLINEGHEIKRYIEPGTKNNWAWEMGNHKTFCGGTHVKNSKEIGNIKLKRANIGKGKERIECTLVD